MKEAIKNLAIAALRRRARKQPSAEWKLRRALFLQYQSPLGAVVNAAPMFEAFKKAYAGLHITVACHKSNAQIFECDPWIDRIVPTENPQRHFFRALIGLLKARRAGAGYDCVIADCWNQQIQIAILGMISGARFRVGFSYSKLLDHCLNYDPTAGVLASNLQLATVFGAPFQFISPKLYFSDADLVTTRSFLKRSSILDTDRIVVFATQFSGGFPKKREWRAEYFAELADYLIAQHGVKILFLGTAPEGAAIEQIRSLMKFESYSAAGAFTIRELSALLCHCELAVTLDSGPMHVCRASELPTVVIARPWQPLKEWLPWDVKNMRILIKEDWVDRSRRDASFVIPDTIDEISVREVIGSVEELMVSYPSTHETRQKRIAARLKRESAYSDHAR